MKISWTDLSYDIKFITDWLYDKYTNFAHISDNLLVITCYLNFDLLISFANSDKF